MMYDIEARISAPLLTVITVWPPVILIQPVIQSVKSILDSIGKITKGICHPLNAVIIR